MFLPRRPSRIVLLAGVFLLAVVLAGCGAAGPGPEAKDAVGDARDAVAEAEQTLQEAAATDDPQQTDQLVSEAMSELTDAIALLDEAETVLDDPVDDVPMEDPAPVDPGF